MTEISLLSIYKHDPNIVCREIAGEMILVPIRSNVSDMASIYTLNETAAVIWQHLDGQSTLDEIKEVVIDQFDVPPDEAEQDLFELVENLAGVGALVRVR
jgi:hypothetical protein